MTQYRKVCWPLILYNGTCYIRRLIWAISQSFFFGIISLLDLTVDSFHSIYILCVQWQYVIQCPIREVKKGFNKEKILHKCWRFKSKEGTWRPPRDDGGDSEDNYCRKQPISPKAGETKYEIGLLRGGPYEGSEEECCLATAGTCESSTVRLVLGSWRLESVLLLSDAFRHSIIFGLLLLSGLRVLCRHWRKTFIGS